MLRSIITQRILVLLDAALLGFIIDRLYDSPRWGFFWMIITGGLGLLLVSKRIFFKTKLEANREMIAILVSTVLAFLFFIECAAAAWLIVA